MTKIIPLLAELAFIAIACIWLRNRPWLRWLGPGLLALSPGIIGNTMWWGQYDSLVSLFLILALIALNKDRPLIAWAMLALGLMSKQQAVVLVPLALVLTWRRYSLRATLSGLTVCAVICCIITA